MKDLYQIIDDDDSLSDPEKREALEQAVIDDNAEADWQDEH